MSETFEAKIERVAAALHTPAGESPKFSSLDAIRKHRGEFVLECHKTWKTWHQEAVYQLLVFDAFAQREQTNPIGRATAEFADYNRALWRKVNDAIVWSVFGSRRDVVKRFCLYRPRSYLAESNAAAAMGAVATLNANPLSIALWTDRWWPSLGIHPHGRRRSGKRRGKNGVSSHPQDAAIAADASLDYGRRGLVTRAID